MTELSPHKKRILVVEDQEQFYGPVRRWLEDEGYHVTLATNYQDAHTAIHTHHFHLAVVDMSLVHDDPTDQGGMNLLREIEDLGLNRIMPCIVLTANVNVSNLLEATQERRVAAYIQKASGYRTKLLTAVRNLFSETIRINFDLAYDVGSVQLIQDVADDVNWSMSGKPDLGLLASQVRDLFGKLFAEAKRVHIAKLKPGLTGAAVIRVQPTWDHGLGPPYVAKIGRDDKVHREAERYETYVRRYLPPNTIAQVKDVAYTRHVGALLYTFAENDMVPLREFDEFYRYAAPGDIVTSLRNLFETTCRYWYDARERRISDLVQLYYEAFQLGETKLVQRIQVVLPEFDADTELFQFDHAALEALNPIAWLQQYRHEYVIPSYHCITHGDLTGRNIMVDQTNKCWLIDFYRTRDSHILRDFVILETDIKFRLLPQPSFEKFLRMEEGLLLTDDSGKESTINLNLSSDMRKAMTVVNLLRSLAAEFVSGGFRTKPQDSRREYLISLLLATLNVVRLRHIPEERKFQALLSASLICAELDKLAGREPARPRYLEGEGDGEKETAVSATAQQRRLGKLLSQHQLLLFLGSDTPTGFSWLNSVDSIVQLPWEAVYTTTRNQQLENKYRQYQIPHEIIVRPGLQRAQTVNGDMPVYKLYESPQATVISGQRLDDPHWQQFAQQIRLGLRKGQTLLVLCASESEMKMVHETCYADEMAGRIWVSDADISEEGQDAYRTWGWRVVPDTPDTLLDVLIGLTAEA